MTPIFEHVQEAVTLAIRLDRVLDIQTTAERIAVKVEAPQCVAEISDELLREASRRGVVAIARNYPKADHSG
jgi:hypothetical protein